MRKVEEADVSTPREHGFSEYRKHMLEIGNSLSKRLQQVAAYSLSHPDECAFGTIGEVADRIGVHPSTLVRFAQKIGYKGFNEFQTIFQQRVKTRASAYEDRVKIARTADQDEDGIDRIFAGTQNAAHSSIERILDRAHIAKFELITAILAQADTIYLIGQRRVFPAVAYLSYMLTQLRIKNHLVVSPVGIETEQMRFASKNDVGFAISFSPYSPLTIDRAKMLKERGVPLISITDSVLSPLVQFSEQWIEIVEDNYAGFRSLAGTMTVVQTIAIAVAVKRQKAQDAGSSKNAVFSLRNEIAT